MTVISEHEMLADHTTLRVGGVADRVVLATTEEDILKTVKECDANEIPLLILGGGSNVVICDEGFRGTVLLIRTSGYEVESDACSGAMVTVQAGHNWDEFVQEAISNEWYGIEALSGIPGTVGATPIQNVGAYGQEVSQTIAHVRTYDREKREIRTFYFADCQFDYRTSIFKTTADRFVILQVAFQLRLGQHSAPIEYAELAKNLGVELGKRSTSLLVREEVLKLRNTKGMVLNPVDHDTWSVGSFFTNPIRSQNDSLPTDCPRWLQPDGRVKLSAAWLVENSGNAKGFGINQNATLSNKHSLAITNRGNATASDVLELANHIKEIVNSKFGIELELEPKLIGNF